MKLWLISQATNNDYGTYDSAVVAAETEEEAKRMHPGNGEDITKRRRGFNAEDTWVNNPDRVHCKYIGEAAEGTEKSIIIASFVAG